MYNEDDFLLLSGIQHFSFCRRQWALIHLENQWQENVLTTEGKLLHTRVHDNQLTERRGGELVVRGMPVKSARLGISGECDAVVFTQTDGADGAVLHGREGTWRVLPVEYKRGKSKAGDCDRLQAAAQAMCLEEMFCCRVERAALYYFETRRREYLEVTPALRGSAEAMLEEMHALMRRGYTPKVRPSAACRSCSLRDLCLPELLRKKEGAGAYVAGRLREEDA